MSEVGQDTRAEVQPSPEECGLYTAGDEVKAIYVRKLPRSVSKARTTRGRFWQFAGGVILIWQRKLSFQCNKEHIYHVHSESVTKIWPAPFITTKSSHDGSRLMTRPVSNTSTINDREATACDGLTSTTIWSTAPSSFQYIGFIDLTSNPTDCL